MTNGRLRETIIINTIANALDRCIIIILYYYNIIICTGDFVNRHVPLRRIFGMY